MTHPCDNRQCFISQLHLQDNGLHGAYEYSSHQITLVILPITLVQKMMLFIYATDAYISLETGDDHGTTHGPYRVCIGTLVTVKLCHYMMIYDDHLHDEIGTLVTVKLCHYMMIYDDHHWHSGHSETMPLHDDL